MMNKKRSSIHRESIRRQSKISISINQPIHSRKKSVFANGKHLSCPLADGDYSIGKFRNNSVVNNKQGLPTISLGRRDSVANREITNYKIDPQYKFNTNADKSSRFSSSKRNPEIDSTIEEDNMKIQEAQLESSSNSSQTSAKNNRRDRISSYNRWK